MTEDWRYFRLEELTCSTTALRNGIDNMPPEHIMKELDRLVRTILDPIRELIGCPLRVTSGYRCPQLNAMVGGARNSLHMQGLAADIVCNSLVVGRTADLPRCNMVLYDTIKERLHDLPIDLVIAEQASADRSRCNWIHIQAAPPGKTPRYLAL